MMDKERIYIFQPDSTCAGYTTQYTECVEIKELLRQWSLAFTVPNTNPLRPYIQRNAQYMIHGQRFDHKRMSRNVGSKNTTSMSMAYHVSRRLDSYSIPAGYSYVGSAQAIIADILSQAVDSNGQKASAQFSVGTCANVSGSYSPGNTQPISAYTAIQGLVALGVEPQFDNFTVNAPVRWGADRGMTFKFGRNLADLDFEDDADQNTTTYSPDAANRQYSTDATPRDYAECGDTVRIKNDLLSEDIRTQRIVTLETHWDDHTGDKFTVGQFVSDLADSVTSMQIGIANSVQQAAQYSNVSIDHQNGFMAISQNGLIKVTMNATNCFSVYSRASTSDDWALVQELDSNGLYSSILTGLNSNMYAEVGTGSNGFALYYKSDTTKTPFLKIWQDTNGYTHITTPGGKLDFSTDDEGNSSAIPNFPGYTGQVVIPSGATMTFKNGILTGASA